MDLLIMQWLIPFKLCHRVECIWTVLVVSTTISIFVLGAALSEIGGKCGHP